MSMRMCHPRIRELYRKAGAYAGESPGASGVRSRRRNLKNCWILVDLVGIEPTTSSMLRRLRGVRAARRNPERSEGPHELVGFLVDLVGIEPTTSSMPWKRAPSCATGPFERGMLINSYARALVSQTSLCQKNNLPTFSASSIDWQSEV